MKITNSMQFMLLLAATQSTIQAYRMNPNLLALARPLLTAPGSNDPIDPSTQINEICLLPKYKSRCRAYIKRFFYDHNTRKCRRFTFGGCNTNENNFSTKIECENVCINQEENFDSPKVFLKASIIKESIPKEIQENIPVLYFPTETSNQPDTENLHKFCKPRINTGLCRGALPRFAYSSEHKKCINFIFGGCMKNSNNFASMQECEDICMQKEIEKETPKAHYPNNPQELQGGTENLPSECQSAINTGFCRAHIVNYAYSSEHKKCIKFIFGGCSVKNNKNNFASLEDCNSKCVESS